MIRGKMSEVHSDIYDRTLRYYALGIVNYNLRMVIVKIIRLAKNLSG